MFLNSIAKVHNNFDMYKYPIINLLCITHFYRLDTGNERKKRIFAGKKCFTYLYI